jgi:iron only hydrogenase large subunit-like protein
MIREEHIDVKHIAEAHFDEPMGDGTGAGIIFGATGGVMEAALRTAYLIVTGETPANDMFEDVRGLKGWKEATFNMAGTPVRVAVVSGLDFVGSVAGPSTSSAPTPSYSGFHHLSDYYAKTPYMPQYIEDIAWQIAE